MSTKSPILIEESNVSVAWARALLASADANRDSLRPLVLTIGGFAGPIPSEQRMIRDALDQALAALGKNPVDVSAMMIFPYKPWIRRGKPSPTVFRELCIKRLLPRLKRLDRRNQNGTYFERMMSFSGVRSSGPREIDQLQFVIDLLRNPDRRPRQSALQIAIFDPAKDHTGQPVRGFPCLQQVSVGYDDDGQFALSAYYPTQYIFDRAYGNYLGLCHLGHFLADATKLRFARLTCFVGRPELGDVSKRDLASLIQTTTEALSVPASQIISAGKGQR
jgi:hypothetical protein